MLNLSRAVQISVDLTLHALSSLKQAIPDTMGEAFDQLAQAAFIPAEPALRLRKAVGFHNIAVRSYSSMDWAIVHAIATHHLGDFEDFARRMNPDLA